MRRLAVLTAALLTAGILGCSSGSSSAEGLAGAQFFVQEPDGQSRAVEDFEEIRGAVPFEVVLPTLPEGASIVSVAAILPPSSIDEEARDRVVAVRMFGESGDDGVGLFQLDASVAGATPGSSETTSVTVGSTEGTLLDDGNTVALGWRSCDVGYLLAYGPDLLSNEDALAIATSIDESCR